MNATTPLVLTREEYDAIHGELNADLDPSMDHLGMLLPRDRQYDLGDIRRAIRRLQTKVDAVDALEVAASDAEGDVTLPLSAASDLRELLPAMIAYVDETVGQGHALPDDAAMWKARQRAVHAVAARLGVEIAQPVA